MNLNKLSLITLVVGLLIVPLLAMDISPDLVQVSIKRLVIRDAKFEVVVELYNHSDKPLQFLDLESNYGREIASFGFQDLSGAVVRVHRKENTADFSGKPQIAIIEPGKSKEWTFDLNDGTWQIPEYIGDGSAENIEVELNAPSAGHQGARLAWAGNLRSKQQKLSKPLRLIWTANAMPFWPAEEMVHPKAEGGR